jgi:hypothetical protein
MQPRPRIAQVVQTRPSQAITYFLSGEFGTLPWHNCRGTLPQLLTSVRGVLHPSLLHARIDSYRWLLLTVSGICRGISHIFYVCDSAV